MNRTRALALPTVFLATFVLLTLVLGLMLTSQNQAGLSRSVEGRMAEKEVADVVFGHFQNLLREPRPADLAALGLSAPPPPPGGGVVPFQGEIQGVRFWGSFNGGAAPWSTWSPPDLKVDPEKDGFGALLPGFDPARFPVPARHSLVFVNVQAEGEPQRTYFTLFANPSGNPVVSARGSVFLREVSGTDAPVARQGETDPGYPIRVLAGREIELKKPFPGRALISEGDPDEEEGEEENPDPGYPVEFVEKLLAQAAELAKLAEGQAEDPGVKEAALAVAAAAVLFKGFELIDLGGFGFDGKTLTWNPSLWVPSKLQLAFPLDLKIRGDLILDRETLFVAGGDLTVEGHLILHKDAILVVAGELEVEDRVEVAFEAGENLSLRTAILVNGDIDLKQGVRHLKRSQKGQVVSPFNL
ncbi:MAG: hypothetical protein AB1758_29105, partial [Candidatus Eremiobacterota bacterium]